MKHSGMRETHFQALLKRPLNPSSSKYIQIISHFERDYFALWKRLSRTSIRSVARNELKCEVIPFEPWDNEIHTFFGVLSLFYKTLKIKHLQLSQYSKISARLFFREFQANLRDPHVKIFLSIFLQDWGKSSTFARVQRNEGLDKSPSFLL